MGRPSSFLVRLGFACAEASVYSVSVSFFALVNHPECSLIIQASRVETNRTVSGMHGVLHCTEVRSMYRSSSSAEKMNVWKGGGTF